MGRNLSNLGWRIVFFCGAYLVLLAREYLIDFGCFFFVVFFCGLARDAAAERVQYVINEKARGSKERVQVDGVFAGRIAAILRIIIPGPLSPEMFYMLLVAASLVTRSVCDIWMIQNGTSIERCRVSFVFFFRSRGVSRLATESIRVSFSLFFFVFGVELFYDCVPLGWMFFLYPDDSERQPYRNLVLYRVLPSFL